MDRFENEHGVTSIINGSLIVYCDKEDVDLIPNTRATFQGAMWNGNRMHRKVMQRITGTEPEVVNHISHLEYDNRRNNLMNCDTSYNMRDVYGRSAYSVLNDCKWCQDLYLLYMTNAITPEEFLYLRLLRLSCFPSVVCKCLGHVDTQHEELHGVCLTYDLFEKYDINVKRQWYSDDDSLFRQEPCDGCSLSQLFYDDNIYEFSKELKENRLNLYRYMDLSNEEQVTSIDEMILSEFSQVFLSYGGTRDVFRSAVFDYLKICNYRFRFLWLLRNSYCFKYSNYYIEDAEVEYTSTLEVDGRYKKLNMIEFAPYSEVDVLKAYPELIEAITFLQKTKDEYFLYLKLGTQCNLDFKRYFKIGEMLKKCIPNISDLMPQYTKDVLEWFKYKAGFTVDDSIEFAFQCQEVFAQKDCIY